MKRQIAPSADGLEVWKINLASFSAIPLPSWNLLCKCVGYDDLAALTDNS